MRAPWVALLVLAALPHAGASELDLPSRTVVVRDFARLRQDLLDTLRVNLPDAAVDILQFRGADVVLSVVLRQGQIPEDQAGAVQELRRYCDRLIRSAAPGMRLSAGSTLVLEASSSKHPTSGSTMDILARLREATGSSERATGATTSSSGTAEMWSDDPKQSGHPTPHPLLKDGLRAYLAKTLARHSDEDGAEPALHDREGTEGLQPRPGHGVGRTTSHATSRIGVDSRGPDRQSSGASPSVGDAGARVSGDTEDEDRGGGGLSSQEVVRSLYRKIHADLAVSRVHADLRSALDQPPTDPEATNRPATLALVLPPAPVLRQVRRSDEPRRPVTREPGGTGSLFDLFDSGSQGDLAEPPVLDGQAP